MALSLFEQARAIVWAQWRTIFNRYPRANKWTAGLTMLLTLVWYAGWAAGALALGAKIAALSDLNTGKIYVSYGLLLGFFYWRRYSYPSLSCRCNGVYDDSHGAFFNGGFCKHCHAGRRYHKG